MVVWTHAGGRYRPVPASRSLLIGDAGDVSLIRPKRRFVPARVRRATEFVAAALPQRV
jgi:hypothetical protein